MNSRNNGLILAALSCVVFFVNAAAAVEITPTYMVVDFDLTYVDSTISQGESGVLNLVIENTGGMTAENVYVWLSSTAVKNMAYSGRIYVGRVNVGESKTIPVIITVDDEARIGLNTIKARIEYNGFDSNGRSMNNQYTTWEIPFTIQGDPLFHVTPSKTTYFKDSVGELDLVGLAKMSVKDLETVLSSDCVTVLGSSRQYVGKVEADREFNITYEIKPSAAGTCEASITLYYTDESGSRVSDEISLGLVVEEAGVDFKIVNISYEPTGPGETMTLKLSLKNVGKADAQDTTLSLSLSDPFTTADTAEKYFGRVAAGETVDAEFNLAVSWDAETKVYSIPLVVDYKVGGTSYSVEKDVGVDVGGQVILEVINVESSRGSLRVDVANVGTRTAESVKATLIVGEGTRFVSSDSASQSTSRQGSGGLNLLPGMGRVRSTGSANTGNTDQMPQARGEAVNRSGQPQTYVSYKSDIKPTKQTTFTFSASISGPANLILEYTGANNKRVTQREQITAGGLTASTASFGLSSGNQTRSTDLTTYLLYGVFALAAVFAAYKLYRRRKPR